jgi:hypothetical protein
MTSQKKPVKGKRKQGLSAKQKKLAMLLPDVEAGKLSMVQAMKNAGYADSTANQQQEVLGGLRNNTSMQTALRKAGFTEDFLAKGIVEGTKAKKGSQPDHFTRHMFLMSGAKLLDVVPADRKQVALSGIDDLIKAQESVVTDEAAG